MSAIRVATPIMIAFVLALGVPSSSFAASLEKQLIKAVKKGNLDAVTVLLEAGADVGTPTRFKKQTPLHIAVHKGHTEIAAILVVAGANPNAKDHKGRTPVHLAAGRGVVQGIVSGTKSKAKSLTKSAACKSVSVAEKGTMIGTSATRAASTWAMTAASALCGSESSEGEDTLTINKARGLVVLLVKGGDPNVRDDNGQTPLHIAAHKGQKLAVQVLIDAGADIEVMDFKGRKPMEFAVDKGHVEVIALLNEAAKTKEEDQ